MTPPEHIHQMRQKRVGVLFTIFGCVVQGCNELDMRPIGAPT